MKKLVTFLTVLSFLIMGAIGLGAAEPVEKGDTLIVPNKDAEGNVPGALNHWLESDTTEEGEQAHSVYKLKLGQTYIITSIIETDGPFKLVADEPTADQKPPILRPGLKEDGSAPQGLFRHYGDVTMENLWLSGVTPDGSSNAWWWIIDVAGVNKTIKYEGVIIENPWTDWEFIRTTGGENTWKFIDVYAKNSGNPGMQWNGAIMTGGGADSIIVRNSTYFNIGCYAFTEGGNSLYAEIENNTFVNTVAHQFQLNRPVEAHVNNNIFYNNYAYSGGPQEINAHPDKDIHGIIHTFEIDSSVRDSLFMNIKGYDPNGDGTFTEDERVYELTNNNWYYSQGIRDYWANNDTVATQKLMADTVKKHFFDNEEDYPNYNAENNTNVNPEFSDIGNQQAFVDNILSLRKGESGVYWFYDGEDNLTSFEWPLEEDLSYSADLTDNSGNKIGDTDWFDSDVITGTEEENISKDFSLEQNYPNPFNPTTTIQYNVKNNSKVTLTIYNVLGEKVKTLVNNQLQSGINTAKWNATNSAGQKVASGVYFYKLQTKNNSEMKKMMLLK